MNDARRPMWGRCRWHGGRNLLFSGKDDSWLRDGGGPPTSRWLSTSSEWERTSAMNNYGQTVQQHWKTWLPSRYAQIEDPTTFFASVGEQIEDQVTQSAAAMEAEQAASLAQMDYLARMGRLNAIDKSAREIALSEWLLEPESDPSEVEMSPEDAMPFMDEMGMPVDRTHPLWEMSAEDHPSTVEEFKAARKAWIAQELSKQQPR